MLEGSASIYIRDSSGTILHRWRAVEVTVEAVGNGFVVRPIKPRTWTAKQDCTVIVDMILDDIASQEAFLREGLLGTPLVMGRRTYSLSLGDELYIGGGR